MYKLLDPLQCSLEAGLFYFPLPNINDAMDASKAANSVLTAVSEGKLTPIEGEHVWGLSIATDALWS